jgi:hypothetical protein
VSGKKQQLFGELEATHVPCAAHGLTLKRAIENFESNTF